MNKFVIIFFFLVFGSWFVLGTNWYVCYVKKECVDRSLEEALAILNTEDKNLEQEEVAFSEDIELVPDTENLIEPVQEVEKQLVAESAEETLKPKKALDKFEVFDGKILFAAGQESPEHSVEVTDHLKSVVKDFLNNKSAYNSLEVSGHTDNIGKAHANTELGFRRANTIKALLMRFGMSNEKVKVKSIGQFRPLGSNKTPEGRKLNRRVEIIFK